MKGYGRLEGQSVLSYLKKKCQVVGVHCEGWNDEMSVRDVMASILKYRRAVMVKM